MDTNDGAPGGPGRDRIRVNGAEHPWRPGLTVADLLAELGLAGPGVAVERNEAVVPRRDHPSVRIEPGDRLEIVRLVGGG